MFIFYNKKMISSQLRMKSLWSLKAGKYLALSLLIQICVMKNIQQRNSNQQIKEMQLPLHNIKQNEQIILERILIQQEIRKVSGNGLSTPTFTQNQPANYSTIQFLLKLDNHGTQAQLEAATTFTIDGVVTNFSVSYSHGVFWLFVVEMTPLFSSSSCIDLSFEYSQMTGFSKAPYQGLSCMTYVQYQDPNSPLIDPPEQDNNTAQIQIQNTTDQANPIASYQRQAQLTTFQNATADSSKIIATSSSLLFKGTLALGAQSLVISLLTFLNLIVLYYFCPVQLPDKINTIFRYVLKGATDNIFLPENTFQFLSTSQETEEIYSQLSIGRNFLSLFSETLILYVVFNIIKKIIDKVTNKEQQPSYKYSELIYFIMYTIGNLPLIIFSSCLNIELQFQFVSIVDKVNMTFYMCAMVIAVCAIICFFLLIHNPQSSDIFSELYMGINHKQNNLHAKEMACLQVLMMITIPALLFVDIRVFWIVNFILISKQIFRLIDKNAFQSKLVHFIRCTNKLVLCINHFMFLGYYLLSSAKHSQIISVLSTIHFFSIITVILLETINFIVEITLEVIQKIGILLNNKVVPENNSLKLKNTDSLKNTRSTSKIEQIKKISSMKKQNQKLQNKQNVDVSNISQINFNDERNNELQQCQIKDSSIVISSINPNKKKNQALTKQNNNNKVSDNFNHEFSPNNKYRLNIGPIVKKKSLTKLNVDSTQRISNRVSSSILDNQRTKKEYIEPFDINKLKLKSFNSFNKTHVKTVKTNRNKQRIRIQQIKQNIKKQSSIE